MAVLQSLIADRWVGSARGRALASAIDGATIHHAHADEIDFAEALDFAARTGVPALMRAGLPAARGAPEGARRLPQRAEGGALRDLAPHRRDPQRRLGRHRGRHRHAVRLRVDGRQRAAVGQRRARRAGGRRSARRGSSRHPHPGAARRRRRAHQRLQLPGLGAAREVRADLSRRHALHRQAGDGDQLPDRGAGADDDGLGPPAARAACSSSSARPATCSTGSTSQRRRHLHRLGRHRAQAARQPQPAGALDPVQRRGRFAQRRRSSAPTCTPDDEEFDLFVKEVAREMTVKAGQKCTAIRRAIVPRRHLDAMAAQLRERLAKVSRRRPGDRGREDGRAGVAGAAAGRGRAGGDAGARQRARLRRRRRLRAEGRGRRPTAPSSRRRCCSAATA